MKLINLPIPADRGAECKKILQHCLEQAEGFDAVVVVAMKKDGTQYMRDSPMTMPERSFLFTFFGAVVNKWFQLDHNGN